MWQRPATPRSLDILFNSRSLLVFFLGFLDEHDRYFLSSLNCYICYWMHRVFIGLWSRFDAVYHPPRRSHIFRRALDDNFFATLPPSDTELALFRAAGFDD